MFPTVANSLLTDSGGLWSYNGEYTVFHLRKLFTVSFTVATPEVSGWGSSNSSLPEEDQASLLSPNDDRPESGNRVASDTEWPKETKEEFTLQADDTLQSVLGRLSLSKHIPLFQVCTYIQGDYNDFILCVQKNEIDLHALLLMKEKDYSEIGLPKVRRNYKSHLPHFLL